MQHFSQRVDNVYSVLLSFDLNMTGLIIPYSRKGIFNKNVHPGECKIYTPSIVSTASCAVMFVVCRVRNNPHTQRKGIPVGVCTTRGAYNYPVHRISVCIVLLQ
jgi:hypothetical protein